MRQLVESGEAGGPPPADNSVEVAAIGLAPERAAALVAAGTERGLAIRAASELPSERPPIALLDGSLHGLSDGVAELSEAGTTVALLLEPDAPHDRVELVRRGARRLLPASASADAVVDALLALTESRRPAAGRILAVDDDPSILLVMDAILGRAGFWWRRGPTPPRATRRAASARRRSCSARSRGRGAPAARRRRERPPRRRRSPRRSRA